MKHCDVTLTHFANIDYSAEDIKNRNIFCKTMNILDLGKT